ncbi:MAG: hypothetical protein U0163_14405 [Gemmatimonadaceae bacterium]
MALFAERDMIGTIGGLALPATGALVRGYGWPTPFYVFGAVGFVWALAWFGTVAREAPAPSRPATSHSVDAHRGAGGLGRAVAGHFCHNWALYLLLAWLPGYLEHVPAVAGWGRCPRGGAVGRKLRDGERRRPCCETGSYLDEFP